MNILAIDPGTKCGYAYNTKGGVISGTWNCQPSRFASAGTRFSLFREHLRRATSMIPDVIVYEEVRNHRGVDAAQIYGGFIAIIALVALEHRIEYRGVPVGTIKKHAGKGNFNKEDMIRAANKFYPAINIVDDNHADALCLLHYTLTEQII